MIDAPATLPVPPSAWTARRIFSATLLALAVAGVVIGLYYYRQVFAAVLVAWMLAIVLRPAVDALARVGLPRTPAVLASFVVLLAVVATAAWFLVPRAVASVEVLAAQIPVWLERLRLDLLEADGRLARHAGRALNGLMLSRPAAAAPQLGMSGGEILAQVSTTALYGIAMVVMAAYLSIDRTAFRRAVSLLLPEARRERAALFLDDVELRLGAYVRGQLVVCLAVGALTGGAYAALGLPHPLMLGALAGVLELVPVLGPALAAIPAILVALKFDGGSMVAMVVVVAGLVQLLESYVISPMVLCGRVGLSPIGLILAVLGFAVLLGPAGAIVAIPSAVVLQLWVERYILCREVVAAAQPEPVGRDRRSALSLSARDISGRLRRWAQEGGPSIAEYHEEVVEELEGIAGALSKRIHEDRPDRTGVSTLPVAVASERGLP